MIANEIPSGETKVREGITLRSVLVGIVGILVVVLPAIIADHKMVYWVPVDSVPSLGAIGVIILMLMFNRIVAKFKAKSLVFSQRELIIIYSMMAMGGLMAGFGGVRALPHLALALTFGRSGMHPWGDKVTEEVASFAMDLPSFIAPKNEEMLLGFYRGLDSTSLAGIPWRLWTGPAIFYTLRLSLFIFLGICITTFFRKHWSERERLTYPITIPLLELTSTKSTQWGVKGRIWWDNGLFWLGAGISTLLTIWLVLGAKYGIPVFKTKYTFTTFERYSFLDLVFGRGYVSPALTFIGHNPLVVGIGYFVPTNILAGIWSTTLLFQLWRAVQTFMGNFSFTQYGWWGDGYIYGNGAGFALAVTCIWVIRHEIKEMIKWAFRGGEEADDPNEPTSYRMALFGAIICLILLVIMETMIRVPLSHSILSYLWWAVCFITNARIRSQAGIPAKMASPITSTGPIKTLPPSWFSFQHPASIYSRGSQWPYFVATCSVPSVFLESQHMAEEVGLRKRDMTKVLFLSIGIVLVLSWFVVLPTIYKYGAWTLKAHNWQRGAMGVYYLYLGTTSPSPLRGLIGAGYVFLLSILTLTYSWWPISPIGAAFALTEVSFNQMWFGFFIAWVVKLLVLRYGGAPLYKRVAPLFIGAVIGYAVSALLIGPFSGLLGIPADLWGVTTL
jgi:hypothetical protein